MAKRDIDPNFPPEEIDEDLYLWKYDSEPGAYQTGCVISAHGGYNKGKKFDLSAGITLHFYVAMGEL